MGPNLNVHLQRWTSKYGNHGIDKLLVRLSFYFYVWDDSSITVAIYLDGTVWYDLKFVSHIVLFEPLSGLVEVRDFFGQKEKDEKVEDEDRYG